MTIDFIVPGTPRGKERPRHTRSGHTYTPASTRDYEELIQHCARIAMDGRAPIEGACRVVLVAFYSIPKSATKQNRARMQAGEIIPLVKPDVDNIAKAMLDGMNGIVYQDDKQVSTLITLKRYEEEPGATSVYVKITEEKDEIRMGQTVSRDKELGVV